jgi:hypothetical protein
VPRNIIGTSGFSTGRYHAGWGKRLCVEPSIACKCRQTLSFRLFSKVVNGIRYCAKTPAARPPAYNADRPRQRQSLAGNDRTYNTVSAMFKVSVTTAAIMTFAVVVFSETPSTKTLTAPTFYIAASANLYNLGTTLDLKGVSNLPPGSRLSATLSDFIGYRSSILSQDAVVVLNKDGFFAVTLQPLQGKQFKDNMVCDISLNPNAVRQDPDVLKIVGKKGELLGIENNPQVHKNSGGYYLEALVHIP